MKGIFSAAIAWRYLITKKSHGAVGTISTVSVCAMSIATAAIICVLSVYNGFRREFAVRLDSYIPDIQITPVKGKVMENAGEVSAKIAAIAGVEKATPTLSDNALVIINGREMPVTIHGVEPEEYASVTSIKDIIPADYGSYISTPDTSPSQSVLSIGAAMRLKAYPGDKMLIFAPRREGRVNMANPMASFVTDSLYVTGVYASQNANFDQDGLILPIQTARNLLQYEDQASAIEVKLKSGVNSQSVERDLQAALGEDYVIKDRMRQQEMSFRMVNIEKWVSFLLLGFILVIASFNIISSLSMLVIDKEKALSIFRALGMTRRRIGQIFAWESLYVSLTGGIFGIVLGIILCLLQEWFGLIKISSDPTSTILRNYPVDLQFSDIWITLIPILCIAVVTALITASFARSRIKSAKRSRVRI